MICRRDVVVATGSALCHGVISWLENQDDLGPIALERNVEILGKVMELTETYMLDKYE